LSSAFAQRRHSTVFQGIYLLSDMTGGPFFTPKVKLGHFLIGVDCETASEELEFGSHVAKKGA
jgi:hypothetical protein